AQVDEAQAAEVAGDVGPAAQGDGLADQGLVDEAAEMGTHGGLRGGSSGRAGKPRILARDALAGGGLSLRARARTARASRFRPVLRPAWAPRRAWRSRRPWLRAWPRRFRCLRPGFASCRRPS